MKPKLNWQQIAADVRSGHPYVVRTGPAEAITVTVDGDTFTVRVVSIDLATKAPSEAQRSGDDLPALIALLKQDGYLEGVE